MIDNNDYLAPVKALAFMVLAVWVLIEPSRLLTPLTHWVLDLLGVE